MRIPFFNCYYANGLQESPAIYLMKFIPTAVPGDNHSLQPIRPLSCNSILPALLTRPFINLLLQTSKTESPDCTTPATRERDMMVRSLDMGTLSYCSNTHHRTEARVFLFAILYRLSFATWRLCGKKILLSLWGLPECAATAYPVRQLAIWLPFHIDPNQRNIDYRSLST